MSDNEKDNVGCSEPDCNMPPELVRANGFCDSHGPDAEQVMSERGRKGAEATKRTLDAGSLLPIESAEDVRKGAALLADAVAAGRIAESRARAAKKALKLCLDGLEAELAEEKFQEVRKKVDRIREEQKRDSAENLAPWEK